MVFYRKNELYHSIWSQPEQLGKNSNENLNKRDPPCIKEKMEFLYEKVLDYLLANQDKLIRTERVKLFDKLLDYIFPKTKPVRDEFTLELKEMKEDCLDNFPDPTNNLITRSID